VKLDAFRFRHVGPFGAQGIEVSGLRPGLNVIAEHNERGKSSLLAALETVLFLPHSSWKGDAKRLLRDDGSPVGEVDFTYEGRPYRLTKRFVKSKHAELIDLGSGAVIATKREAEERVGDMLGLNSTARGPSGLLWVRQGDSMDQAQDDGQVASRLESELSTLVGGERARAYLDRTETELENYFTAKGYVKKGGLLNLTEDGFNNTQEALTAARAAQAATAQMGRDLIRVHEHIAKTEAQGDTEHHARELREARDALDKARLAQSELNRQHEQLARLTAETERADAKLADHLKATQSVDQANADVDAITAQIAILNLRKSDAKVRLATLAEDLQRLDAHRAAVAKRDADQARRERIADRNSACNAVIVKLEALDQELEQRAACVVKRDVLPAIDRNALAQIEALARTIDQTNAALAHVGATLVLDLKPGVTARIGDRPVTNGPVRLDATHALTLEGIGKIQLAAPEAEDLRKQLADAQNAHDELLETWGMDSPEAAAAAMRQRQDISNDIAMIDRQITLIAPDGRDALIDTRERLTRDIETLAVKLNDYPPDLDDIDPDALASQLAQAQGEQRAAQDSVNTIEQELATLQERLKTRQRDLSSAPETASMQSRETHYGQLAAAAASLATQTETARTALDTAKAQGPTDPALLEARIKRLSDFADTRAETLSRLRVEAAELAARRRESFEQRDPDAEVTRLTDRLETLRETVARHRQRAAALTLLRDTLQTSQRSLQDQYTEPVRKKLLPLLRGVIDGADIKLNETLGASGLIRNGQDDHLDQLSGGTQEQIAILTRLAFAQLLAESGHPCPVILDDALVYADDQRRGRMFDILRMITDGPDPLQILYLTCHEANATQLGGNRLGLSDWPEQG
jgi:hypothetical protein